MPIVRVAMLEGAPKHEQQMNNHSLVAGLGIQSQGIHVTSSDLFGCCLVRSGGIRTSILHVVLFEDA